MVEAQTQRATSLEVKAINLIEGTFTPSEAADILYALLDKKINFHKIQRLKRLEGNHDDSCRFDSGRLGHLEEEKERLKMLLKEARLEGKHLVLNSTINIEVK